MPLSEILLIVMSLLALATLAAGFFYRLPVLHTVVLVVIGMALGELSGAWEPLADLQAFRLTSDLVFFLFLPALIFESGFNLNARQLVKDLAPVLVLAVPALLISTALVGFGLWWLLDLELPVALLFGALISATDPVAVIALFKELGAPLRLTVLVEGESLLNDATAIVVFSIVLGIALDGGGSTLGTVGWAVLDFFRVFLGGALVGCLLGLGISELLCRLKCHLSAVLVMSIVMAYMSFILAEHLLHVSGVMAAAAAAVSLAVLGVTRMPPGTDRAIGETWEFIALACNSLLFILVGLSIDPGTLVNRLDVIGIAVTLVLAARAATVYSLVPATTRLFSLPRVSIGERHIMWWGGLKGGLAIAIVLSIPEQLPGRQLLIELTVGVVLFTLLVNAPTIRPLMSRLGLDRFSDEEHYELEQFLSHAQARTEAKLAQFESATLISAAGRSSASEQIRKVFTRTAPAETPAERDHELYLAALRTEFEELNRLHDGGVISQYTFLDWRSLLQRDRDTHCGTTAGRPARARTNLFMRLEMALLRQLREHDWAAGWLSRYQDARLSQHLQHNIAGVLMCEAVLEKLRTLADPAVRPDPVSALYAQRLARRRERIETIRIEFPAFYRRFEVELATRMVLTSAKLDAEHDHQHGEIGAKVFTTIEQRIDTALAKLASTAKAAPTPSTSALLDTIPLLKGLSKSALDAIADRANAVTFLPGDIVIGEGEKGDALYIVSQGKVGVHHSGDGGEEQFLAELGHGDFFGETALLGEQVRTATVEAQAPSTLPRITRRDMLALAEQHPEVEQRLDQARAARTRDTKKVESPGG